MSDDVLEPYLCVERIPDIRLTVVQFVASGILFSVSRMTEDKVDQTIT